MVFVLSLKRINVDIASENMDPGIQHTTDPLLLKKKKRKLMRELKSLKLCCICFSQFKKT